VVFDCRSIEEEIEPNSKIYIDDIQRAVCKYFGVSHIDLISARRTVQIVRPRQVGYYLAKMLTLHSLPEIGRRFGYRDHTSCLSGIRKITRLIESDENLARDVQTLTASVGGSIA
jgi:chromosomal replication initiator protein